MILWSDEVDGVFIFSQARRNSHRAQNKRIPRRAVRQHVVRTKWSDTTNSSTNKSRKDQNHHNFAKALHRYPVRKNKQLFNTISAERKYKI